MPNLIDEHARYFIGGALKKCNQVRKNSMNYIYNLAGFFAILLIIILILATQYKGYISPIEKETKKRKEYEKIMTKLQEITFNQKKNNNLITELPIWENNLPNWYNNIV